MSVNGNKLAPNPFERRLKLTFLNKLQIAFMSVTIFPIRLVLALSCIGLLCMVCFVATFSLPSVAVRPIYGWRRKLKFLIRGLLRGMFFFSSMHWVEVKGKENMENGHEPDIIIAAPHTTFYDPILMFAFTQLPTGISRIENIELPILGNVTKYFMPISVARDDPESRRKTINEIKDRLKSRVQYMKNRDLKIAREDNPSAMNWPTLYSFSEGTVGNGDYLMKFKYGAFIPGHPVQPVFIRHHNPMNTTTWTWIGPSLYKIIWLTLCQFQTTTVINILPLYKPSQREKEDAKLFANNVRGVIARHLGVGVVDMDYNDADIFVYLSKLSLRPLNVMVLLNRLLKKSNFKDHFSVLSFVEKNFLSNRLQNLTILRKNPFLNLTEFNHYIGQLQYIGQKGGDDDENVVRDVELGEVSLGDTLEVEEVFKSCLEEGESRLDVRKFLLWLCLCSYPEDTDSVVKLAFKLYNSSNDRKALNREEMALLLEVLFQCNSDEIHEVLRELFNFSNELSFGYFRAYSVNEGSKSFRKYQRMFSRFFKPKRILMTLPPGEERGVVQ